MNDIKKILVLLSAAACLMADAADKKLMSFNILHCEGIDKKINIVRTAAAITKENPDFVGLQEVDRNAAKRSGGVDQPAELSRLTGMHVTFAKAIPYQGGEYGVAVLSREKPISVFRTPLPGTEPRVLLLCEFRDCWFGTTHLSVSAESERVESIDIIRRAVAERAVAKPVYLTGDWNAVPTSTVLAGMRKFMTVLSDENCRTYHDFKQHDPSQNFCIDYIAVDSGSAKKLVVCDAHVVPDTTTSDHSPVVVTVCAPTKPFVVSSFNMRTDCGEKGDRAWSNRCSRVVKIILDHDMDVIGAQELKHNQVADLRAALGPKGYEIIGRGRLEGGKSEGVYMIYNAKRFLCTESDTFQLSETPDVWGSSSWGSAYPRTCVWVQLKDRTDGAEFRFYNTHLDHVSELARKNGMKLMLSRIETDVKAGTTAFLTGDFNNQFAPGNAVALARDAMKDTAALSLSPHLGPTNTYHGYKPPACTLIDYVFAKGPVRVLSHATLDDMPDGKVPTDHYPVIASVCIPSKAKSADDGGFLADLAKVEKSDAGTVVLEGTSGKVTVDLHGGRILSWKTAAGEELLFMPERKESPDGDWSHGGISICWPWFGKKGGAAASIHGFARNRMFSIRRRNTSDGETSVTLGLALDVGAEPEFPYAADLELAVRLTDRLSVTLRTANIGKVPFSYSEGFQPYFNVSDYGKVTLRGVREADFAAVNGMDAAFPRIGDGVALADVGKGYELCASLHGNTGVVVWSPGNVEPHNRNLAAGDTEKFIGLGPSCREKEGAIKLAPGESHVLSFEIERR